MSALLDISTDTRYLSIDGTPLTQAAVEQLERAWLGKDLTNANWLARVVIAHGVGDQRMAHDVALGQLRSNHPRDNFIQLVAIRISDVDSFGLKDKLRQLPFALLMF